MFVNGVSKPTFHHLLLMITVSLFAYDSTQAAETRVLILHRNSTTNLLKPGGQVDQVIPLPDGGFVVRDYSWERERQQALEIYDSEGNWVRKIGSFGQSPGQYSRLKSAALADDKTLWVGDAQGRISLFDLSGTFLESFLIQTPGYRVRGMALDESHGYFYLTGCLPRHVYIDKGCTLVHQYNLKNKKYIESFIETEPEAVRNHWLPLEDYIIDIDLEGRVFMTDAPIMKLYRYDPRTDHLDKIPIKSNVVDSPAPIIKVGDRAANEAARANSFLIERVLVIGRHVVVSIAKPGSASRQFILQIFDVDGDQIIIDKPAPGYLVGKSRSGELLFATNKQNHFELTAYSLKGDLR